MPLVATLFVALIAVSVSTQRWRPGHVAVYAACLAFVAAAFWTAPRARRTRLAYLDSSAEQRRPAAKAAAVWALALLVVLLGGLALVGVLAYVLG